MDAQLPTFNPHDESPENIAAAAGQLLVVGFDGKGETPPEAIREALARDIGGVILFRRNVDSIEQVCALNEAVHAAAADAAVPPFVAVDQEGGRVVRLKDPLTPIPPMRAVGDVGDAQLASKVSEVIATEVGAVGFNVNFTPVLDVDTNPENPIIGDRSFSPDPELVAQMGGAVILGHTIAGVIPCGKHFPGHGDTILDSHLDLPVLDHEPERLEQIELHPFQRCIGIDVPMLMTAHILYPRLDTDHPATLSHAVIHRLLREELGYEGVVVSDDLEMKAVADRYEIEEMLELGLRAGVDLFLVCHTEELWKRAHAHLVQLATKNAEDRRRVFESANRIAKLKRGSLGSWSRPWKPAEDWRSVLGCAEHRETMARVRGALS